MIVKRGTFIPAIAACFAILCIADARPALSIPASAALQYGETRAGVLQEVGKRYRYSRNWNRRPYYRSYAYRPYAYRPYGYYRPYSYYGYGYPYYRRPGISLWFGF